MKIATYNAASVRARLPRLTEWLAENQPDLIAVQETKVENLGMGSPFYLRSR
jgi:exodeoxyribonuclease III